jgi:uncharacterized protein YbjT (DUF2867 family)
MAKVAIAGASGFVGAQLIERLRGEHQVRALGRRAGAGPVEWRRADLFSAGSTRSALEGIEVAYYLVHSMLPSTRLFQGTFHDTDLLLADNFARACAAAGVRQIIYLGGLLPASGYVSPHLASRGEVEGVLASTGVPVTVLRAGMVVGPGGSSFEILTALVRRLPVMILPRWTRSQSQAVFVDDVVAVLAGALDHPGFLGRTLDLVNGERLTYEQMLREVALALGLRRPMLRVPIASTGFSKLWVGLFGSASRELVSPLIDSLLCDLPQGPPAPQVAALIRYPTFRAMLGEALARPAPPPRPAAPPASGAPTVRSIQRLPPLPGRDAAWIGEEYMRWLPRFLRGLLRVRTEGARVEFVTPLLRAPLLVLELIPPASDSERVKFHLVGGLLTRTTTTGWLEFRQVDRKQYTLAAIHEFVPALPWLLYRVSQAVVHLWVMEAFGRHLARDRGPELDLSARPPASPRVAAAPPGPAGR